MRNSIFRFKSFSVRDEFSAHKVGTDGVLLGAWSSLASPGSKLLDIGSGCGLIALMCAQKNPESEIHAVEIDPSSCGEARLNIQNSPWRNRIKVFNASLQDFSADSNTIYDLIVTNPPYFKPSSEAPCFSRNRARQAKELTHLQLLECSSKLLSDKGIFSCIIPYDIFEEFNRFAEDCDLHISRRCDVLPIPYAPPVRVLLEYSKSLSLFSKDYLVIEENGRHHYSEKYKAVTKDFYLNF